MSSNTYSGSVTGEDSSETVHATLEQDDVPDSHGVAAPQGGAEDEMDEDDPASPEWSNSTEDKENLDPSGEQLERERRSDRVPRALFFRNVPFHSALQDSTIIRPEQTAAGVWSLPPAARYMR
ncbi:hypothetical protein BSKO_10174 [Bryopsis sp. KO-2023]|nr:hypothetical protein BSKO_10174 [Bryopsis sp. KO-2023]